MLERMSYIRRVGFAALGAVALFVLLVGLTRLIGYSWYLLIAGIPLAYVIEAIIHVLTPLDEHAFEEAVYLSFPITWFVILFALCFVILGRLASKRT